MPDVSFPQNKFIRYKQTVTSSSLETSNCVKTVPTDTGFRSAQHGNYDLITML